ncbi:MAG: hypothetical protein ACOY30_00265 [Bacillota bacterium]
MRQLAEECAASRVYAGVHYPVDVTEGLETGPVRVVFSWFRPG